MKAGQECIRGMSCFFVVERTRIERKCAAEELGGEKPFLFVRQRVEGIEELTCLTAHNFRIARATTDEFVAREPLPFRNSAWFG
jgi:hypothetical protein